jgi:hypothetical protein
MTAGDLTTQFTVTIPNVAVLVMDAHGTAGTAVQRPSVTATNGAPTIRSTSFSSLRSA